MNENSSAEYKAVRGLSRGLLLLNLLNKFDGGATVSTLAEFSGLHRTTVRRLLETLQDEGYVRRSRSDDSFRLTIKVRQLSEGFRDEHWISALATPLLGELLREVLWPTDITTLDVDEEGAFFDFNVQAGQVLIHDAARAEVDVAHFGVTHLTIRQTDFQA